jgi:hypothetical protein
MQVAIALLILLPFIGIIVGIFKRSSDRDSVSAGFAYGFMGAIGLIIAGLVLWVILGGIIVLVQAVRGHH